MSSNNELIKKADLALSDLSTAGKLNPEQSARFFRQIIDSPTLFRDVRVVSMKSPDKKIDKIGFGSRILQAAPTEGTALSTRSAPSLSQVSLTTKEVIASVYIPYSVMEDNIEKAGVDGAMQSAPGGLHGTIVDLIGARAALDMEELALLGDTGSGDPFLALQNGWLKLITSHVNDVGNLDISKDAVKAAVKALPSRFRSDVGAMRHYLSPNNEVEMRDQYANRIGALGDANLQGNLALTIFGSSIKSCANMPGAKGLYVNPKNLIFGIHRDVMIEYDKDIETRMFKIVLTARVGMAIEEEEACVKYVNITNG